MGNVIRLRNAMQKPPTTCILQKPLSRAAYDAAPSLSPQQHTALRKLTSIIWYISLDGTLWHLVPIMAAACRRCAHTRNDADLSEGQHIRRSSLGLVVDESKQSNQECAYSVVRGYRKSLALSLTGRNDETRNCEGCLYSDLCVHLVACDRDRYPDDGE